MKWLRLCSYLVHLWADDRDNNTLYEPVASLGVVEGLVLRLVSSVSQWVAGVCAVASDRRSLADVWNHVVVVGHSHVEDADEDVSPDCSVPDVQEMRVRRQVRLKFGMGWKYLPTEPSQTNIFW